MAFLLKGVDALLTILLPSLQSFFSHRIQNLVLQPKILANFREIAPVLFSNSSLHAQIKLKKSLQTNADYVAPLTYRSAIALQWAPLLALPATQLAETLVMALSTPLTTVDNDWLNESERSLEQWKELWQQSSVYTDPVGGLEWQLNHRGQAIWLQLLVERLPQWRNSQAVLTSYDNQSSSNANANFFWVYHSYARCHSLLQQAQRDGLIELIKTDLTRDTPQNWLPCPPIWLDNQGHSYLNHPAEQQLIAQLAIGLDQMALALAHPHPQARTLIAKSAIALSQRFQAFHANCSIWGICAQQNKLAQARLGLVLATRVVLQVLVQDGLAIPLMDEL